MLCARPRGRQLAIRWSWRNRRRAVNTQRPAVTSGATPTAKRTEAEPRRLGSRITQPCTRHAETTLRRGAEHQRPCSSASVLAASALCDETVSPVRNVIVEVMLQPLSMASRHASLLQYAAFQALCWRASASAAQGLHVRDEARSTDRAFTRSALVSSQNQPSSEPDLPPPAPGVSQKGRLLPNRAPFPFLDPWLLANFLGAGR
jgi:hypothetical protein